MPVAQSRRFRIALWAALAALLFPIGITLSELGSGGAGPWIRLVSLAVVAATLTFALFRQSAVERRVAERERLSEELRSSEAKFSGILGIAADAIITVDQTERIIHFNHGAERIFGYSAGDAVGRHLAMLIPARFRAVHGSHIERFARSADTSRQMGQRREIFGLRSNGHEFPAEASISKLVVPDGVLFTVVLRDITDRKRAEDDERFLADTSVALAKSLDFDAAMQTIADLPVPRLADACLLDVLDGDTFRRVASMSQRVDLTPALQALAAHPVTWDSPSPIIDAIRRGRREHVPMIDDEWLEASEDLAAIPYWRDLGARALLILPLVSAGGTLGAMTLIATDGGHDFAADRQTVPTKFAAAAAATLENSRLYASAQRANRARDEVLSVVSHDLRNPISAIAMCARVLRENPPDDPAKRDELLVSIAESTAWMNRLIQDLLDVASIERGQLSLVARPQDPAQLVLQSLHMFEVEAAGHGIVLSATVPTNLPLITVDGARVVQVLGNLLRNAIKFTPDGGRVVVSVESRNESIVFSVTDSGPGIDPAVQARVFDRYWQSSDGSRTHGTGLGLSIAKGIVDAHGGTISVSSRRGSGSTFTFALPDGVATRPVSTG